jgi:hypothetical protein
MSTNDANGPKLDNQEIAAYEVTIRNGAFLPKSVASALDLPLSEVADIQKKLIELGMLTAAGGGDQLVAVNPDIVRSELSAPLEREIAARRQTLGDIRRQLEALLPLYTQHAPTPPECSAFRLVDDPAAVDRELTAIARGCTQQVLTMQPGGGRNPETLRAAVMRDLAMIERGVEMRILYQHTARASLATRAYVRQVSGAGAQVRTIGEIIERLIIFDRRTALIPQDRSGSGIKGATIIDEPTIVAFLCSIHDNAWTNAQPFEPDSIEYEQTAGTLRSSILLLMSQGLKDAVIARRVGMATRTCRRYISALMEEVGATSRFQAGVRAVQLGLLPAADPGDPPDKDAVPAADDDGDDEE